MGFQKLGEKLAVYFCQSSRLPRGGGECAKKMGITVPSPEEIFGMFEKRHTFREDWRGKRSVAGQVAFGAEQQQ